MRVQYRSNKFLIILLGDVGIFALSLYLSFLMRFDLNIPPDQWLVFKSSLPIFIITKIIAFYMFNLYRGMWRFTSIIDLVSIIKAGFSATLVSAAFLIFFYHGLGFPRTVFFLDFVFSVGLASLSRVGIRIYYQVIRKNYTIISPFLYKKNHKNLKRLVILGAGNTCDKILRELLSDLKGGYKVVGIFDDDLSKVGTLIRGIAVVDTIDKIAKYSELYDEIIISIPSAVPEEMRHILDVCRKTGKKYKIIPKVSEFINGNFSVESAREITISDLIGREEINDIDVASISNFIGGKVVLITGAGGSIGSELVLQCLNFKPEKLVLLDISEYNLFQVERLCQGAGNVIIAPVLADIRNMNSLYYVYRKHRPQIVFHAAAYKHVPIQESQPWETIFTNIEGSRNLVNVSKKYKVDTFVSVSTDKAVRPTNVMGATKRIVEMLIQSVNGKSATKFLAVRFGNVIGSSGSVIPIFQEQIKRGGPVTLTHPDIERYFMSIPEAARLILQAGAIGKSGNIYVLKMGKLHKIKKIAEDLIRLSGLEPEKDIPIEYIGLRPGEKLYEELLASDEVFKQTSHSQIIELEKNGSVVPDMDIKIDKLLKLARTHRTELIRKNLMENIN